MPKPTDDELAAELEAWGDAVDPDDLVFEDTTDLAAVGAAAAAVQAQLQALDTAVAAARRNGRSWTDIGQRVGITRQAALKRWGKTTLVALQREGVSGVHLAVIDDSASSTPKKRSRSLGDGPSKTSTTRSATTGRKTARENVPAGRTLSAAAKTAVHRNS